MEEDDIRIASLEMMKCMRVFFNFNVTIKEMIAMYRRSAIRGKKSKFSLNRGNRWRIDITNWEFYWIINEIKRMRSENVINQLIDN